MKIKWLLGSVLTGFFILSSPGCNKQEEPKQLSMAEKYSQTIIQNDHNRFHDDSYYGPEQVRNIYRQLPNTITVIVQPENMSVEEMICYQYPYFGAIRSITKVTTPGVSITNNQGGSGVIGGDANSKGSNVYYEVVMDKNAIWNEVN